MGKKCRGLYCELLKEKEKEILKLKKQITNWRKQASMDQMTRVFNKCEGLRRLRREIKKTLFEKNTSTTIAFIDIDGLKLINDRFGHCIGDEVLVNVSGILRRNIRKEDFIFRFGGDEFIIVFTNITKLQAKEVWKRVHKVIDQFNKEKKFSFPISLSVGFYEYDGNSNIELDQIIQLADSEMYREKQEKGRNITSFVEGLRCDNKP
ncbi:MAG: GGDEF domain-containing protein [Clostridiaceae bacterium]|nr:GGDEF domain-containing protein [Clostridiaceae bacterium]